jgi:gliding motility-associated lipoprotein GldH
MATTRKDFWISKNLLFCLCSFFCLSCGEKAFYEQYESIEGGYWEKDTEYYFSFNITDTSIPYDLTIEIRNNSLYPYQNLWIFSKEEQPSGAVLQDTTECFLADDYGKWLGKGVSVFQSDHILHSRYYEKGVYTVGFRQGMRNGRLAGVQEIGLRIMKSDPD